MAGPATPGDPSEDWEGLREYALGFPGAQEDHPWGETVIKVRNKVFVFLGTLKDDGSLGLSVKLPASGGEALSLPFCAPTGYGLGKHGWVSARFGPDETPLVGLLRDWIAESYCAVAPKTLAKAWRAAQA
jgi:predicted DNA-binding protein (MmcQ/YjbR family)